MKNIIKTTGILLIYLAALLLSACGTYQPEISGNDVASGSGIEEKKGTEPTLQEVEEAYHFAIQKELYYYGGVTRDGFTGKELTLYRKKEKDGILYCLMDEIKDEEGTEYVANWLYYNLDSERLGFTSWVLDDAYFSEEEKKKALEGAEKLGIIPSWKFHSEKRPKYPKQTELLKRKIGDLKEKIIADAKKNLAVKKEWTCHVYVEHFLPADDETDALVVTEDQNIILLTYNLYPEIAVESDDNRYWSISEESPEDAGMDYLMKESVTDFDITLQRNKPSLAGR